MNNCWIIEHDTRGVLDDQDFEGYADSSPSTHLGWRSKFSPTKLRSEGMQIYGRANVNLAISRISPKLRRQCKVREWGGWTHDTSFDARLTAA